MHNPDPSSHSPRFQPAFLGPQVPSILRFLSSPLLSATTTPPPLSTLLSCEQASLTWLPPPPPQFLTLSETSKSTTNIQRQIGLEAPRALRVSHRLPDFRLIQKKRWLALIYNPQNQSKLGRTHAANFTELLLTLVQHQNVWSPHPSQHQLCIPESDALDSKITSP